MGPGAARLARDMQEHGPIDVHKYIYYATLPYACTKLRQLGCVDHVSPFAIGLRERGYADCHRHSYSHPLNPNHFDSSIAQSQTSLSFPLSSLRRSLAGPPRPSPPSPRFDGSGQGIRCS